MRYPSGRRKSVPIPVDSAPIIACAVGVVIADPRTYNCSIVGRAIIVRSRVTVVVIGGIWPVISGRIIVTGIIRCYIRALRASAHESCYDARTKYR
jgi:hypothetical protein